VSATVAARPGRDRHGLNLQARYWLFFAAYNTLALFLILAPR
jgi:hypothetical protein